MPSITLGTALVPSTVGAAGEPVGAIPPAATGKPAAPTSDTLPDGRVVVLGSPAVATQFLMAKILGHDEELKSNQQIFFIVKALMYLRTVGGVTVTRPTNYVEAQKLMNDLGDEGVDLVTNIYLRDFVLKVTDLPLSEGQ
jgi:hypothetical protein